MTDLTAGVWDQRQIERLGGAIMGAASGARIGISVIQIDQPVARTLFMSDVGAEILGYPKDELLGMSPSDLLVPEERASRAEERARRLRGEPAPRSFETVSKAKDGRLIPLEVSLSEITLEGHKAIVTFFFDITDRRRSLEALGQSEARFRKMTESAPDAIWIFDGRRLCFANDAAARMLAYATVEELLAIDPRDLVHPDERAALVERTRQMFASGQPLESREYRTYRRDRVLIPVEVQSVPIEWEGVPAVLSFGRDVTARKEMEARLIQADRLAALGTLLAGVAHEINNPLTFTLLGLEQAMMALDAPARGPGTVDLARERLRDVREGVQRIASIVGHLRNFSRPETDTRGLVDLRAVADGAARFAENEIRHRARLTTTYEDIPAIAGSASQLEQVILNLLVNAAQALPEGRANNEICIVIRAEGTRVVLEVSDNGAGIEPTAQSHVFEPFFSTKPAGAGMGLGLSICRSIVTEHEGTIEVNSQLGRGTTFRMTLPARSGHAGARVGLSTVAPAPASPRRRRILIVDDEPTVGEVLRRFLDANHDVSVVVEGAQALEFLARHADVDVVLCDLMMPRMTGMDLFAAVAQRHPGVERRFVFMTGGAFTPRAAEFLAVVPNPRLDKPFSFADVEAVIAAS